MAPQSEGARAEVSAASERVVDARRLVQAYPKGGSWTEIIRDLDFDVGAGEFVGVIGLSGCGKSTLLKVLAGLTPFQGGTLEVLGERLKVPGEISDSSFNISRCSPGVRFSPT